MPSLKVTHAHKLIKINNL
uniref:Uncharacterized protein n=1 Tax=Anguilla anguilla TaxID=7936 RepID=A0A0E9VLZ8_ANGAN